MCAHVICIDLVDILCTGALWIDHGQVLIPKKAARSEAAVSRLRPCKLTAGLLLAVSEVCGKVRSACQEHEHVAIHQNSV